MHPVQHSTTGAVVDPAFVVVVVVVDVVVVGVVVVDVVEVVVVVGVSSASGPEPQNVAELIFPSIHCLKCEILP